MSSKFKTTVAIAVALVSLLPLELSASAVEAGPQPSLSEERTSSVCYQTGKILIRATPDQVWKILTDHVNAPHVFKRLRKCQVVEDGGRSKIVHHEIHPSGQPATFEYNLRVKETPKSLIEWQRVSGDFKEVLGYWKIEPAEGGNATVVTYGSYVNGGMFIPQGLIRRQFRIDTPQILLSLKNHAEVSQQIATRRRTASTP